MSLGVGSHGGITDLPFRLICRRLGWGMTVSEMIKGLLYNNVKTKEMLAMTAAPYRHPTFGSVPDEWRSAKL